MKKYYTIGEISELCDLKAHVLRYWEQEFSELSPDKRAGSRRYYQEKDIQTIQKIRELLYDQGMTIAGAKKLLAHRKAPMPTQGAAKSSHVGVKANFRKLRKEMEDLLKALKSTR